MKQTKRNTIELYTEWYLQELKERGLILDWEREPETFEIAPVYKYPRLKRFKKKEPVAEYINLFQKMEYTYDYRIIWHPDARHLFYDLIMPKGEDHIFKYGKPLFVANEIIKGDDTFHVSYIDTKPTSSVAAFGKNSSAITFIYKKRLMWDHHRIYLEKFIPIPMAGSGKKSSIFPNTFTPRRYMMTDGGKQVRKINFVVQNLNGFLLKQKALINNV